MVWQQWVLVAWVLLRLPFLIRTEIERARPEVKPEQRGKATTIAIVALLLVIVAQFALIVTI